MAEQGWDEDVRRAVLLNGVKAASQRRGTHQGFRFLSGCSLQSYNGKSKSSKWAFLGGVESYVESVYKSILDNTERSRFLGEFHTPFPCHSLFSASQIPRPADSLRAPDSAGRRCLEVDSLELGTLVSA